MPPAIRQHQNDDQEVHIHTSPSPANYGMWIMTNSAAVSDVKPTMLPWYALPSLNSAAPESRASGFS